MISNRPYIIRAMYEWMVDNAWTPHIQVDANYPGVRVPQQFVQEGVIVLNIAPSAVVGLALNNDWCHFKARFQGVEQEVGFPPEAVLAIFARENGQGMPFPPEPYPQVDSESEAESTRPGLSTVPSSGQGEPKEPAQKSAKKSNKKPNLSVVK